VLYIDPDYLKKLPSQQENKDQILGDYISPDLPTPTLNLLPPLDFCRNKDYLFEVPKDQIPRTNENGVTSQFDLKQYVKLVKLSRQIHDLKIFGKTMDGPLQDDDPTKVVTFEANPIEGMLEAPIFFLDNPEDNNNPSEGPPTSGNENAGTDEDTASTVGSWLTRFLTLACVRSHCTRAIST
jgi:hypothetical protein